jgi:pilus assembly protein Flp/PilA
VPDKKSKIQNTGGLFMNMLLNLFLRMKSEKGQGMVEYGLIIGLVAIVVIGALIALGGGLNGIFGRINGAISSIPSAT